jgi:hypothetical protein
MTTFSFANSTRSARRTFRRTVRLTYLYAGDRRSIHQFADFYAVDRVTLDRLKDCVVSSKTEASYAAMTLRMIDPTIDCWVAEYNGHGWVVKIREWGKVRTLRSFTSPDHLNWTRVTEFARLTHHEGACLEVD